MTASQLRLLFGYTSSMLPDTQYIAFKFITTTLDSVHITAYLGSSLLAIIRPYCALPS